jgi:hypothetical protein
MDRVTLLRLGDDRSDGGTAREAAAWDETRIGAALAARILPVSLGTPDRGCAAFVTSWDQAIALHDDGVDGIRITLSHEGSRADVLDGVGRGIPARHPRSPRRGRRPGGAARLRRARVRGRGWHRRRRGRGARGRARPGGGRLG